MHESNMEDYRYSTPGLSACHGGRSLRRKVMLATAGEAISNKVTVTSTEPPSTLRSDRCYDEAGHYRSRTKRSAWSMACICSGLIIPSRDDSRSTETTRS